MEEQNEDKWLHHDHHPKSGRILSGIFLIGVGLLFLCRQMGYYFPEWLFHWPAFLIALGIYVGAKHMFRNPGWLFLVLIGGAFMFEDIYPEFDIKNYLLPFFLIVAGLLVVFKPFKGAFRHNRFRRKFENRYRDHDNPFVIDSSNPSSEDMIEAVAIFGGIKKNIVTKTFKGGEVVCVMGGAEINLSQADIEGTVVLEMVQVFGGAKLIVPANWEIRSEAIVILGGIEDKRPPMPDRTGMPDKILVLRGTCIFGGIDIRSY